MNPEQLFAQATGGGVAETADGSARRRGSGLGIDDELAVLLDRLERVRIGPMSRPRGSRALAILGRVRAVAESKMCDVARAVSETDSESDPAEVLRQGARLPGRESKKMARMARQLSDMPRVREKFSKGDITPSHANALANAAEKVGPEKVEADPALLEAADRMSPDSFDRHARKWSERKLIEAGLDPLQRQRRAREAKLWVETDTGLGVLMAKLPRPQFEHLRQAIDSHYLHLLREDGSDGRSPDEVRTPKQRLADVVVELLGGRDSLTGALLTGTVGVKAKASTQVILTVPMGVVDGTEPGGHVEVIGVGPVPRSILETLTPDTELAAMIFDRAGRPLWLGRNQRIGNAAQRLAVAVRDGGCFECGAPMHRCELHHMREWHRDRGRTDIDNLVAVCRGHHRWLETENLVVVRTAHGYEARPRDGPEP